MTAPLVTRLQSALLTTEDPASRALLSVQIACYLARVGEFDEAERLRLELRKEYGDGRNAAVSIRIMCLEALILYFKDLSPNARDRLARANLLAVACNEARLVAFTFAWLAHIDFNLGRYDAMAMDVRKCLAEIEADDGNALCRVSLVLGDAFAYAMQEESERQWYEQARVVANKLGDHAAIGAVTYNRAALHVANARVRCLMTPIRTAAITMLDAEVRSAVNYQNVARLTSLDHLLGSASVGVMMLGEKYEDALKVIDTLISASSVPKESAALALLFADAAVSLARTGQSTFAAEKAALVLEFPVHTFTADDRAVLFGSLCNFAAAVDDKGAESSYGNRRDEALSEHQATISALQKLLEPYAPGPKKPA